MDSDILLYRRKVKKKLQCGFLTRKSLLSKFDSLISHFLDDCPVPTYQQLESAFGPPGEMASVLMGSVFKKEHDTFGRKRKLVRLFFTLLVVLVFLFSAYTYCFKEYTIIEVKNELFEGNIYETAPTQKGN